VARPKNFSFDSPRYPLTGKVIHPELEVMTMKKNTKNNNLNFVLLVISFSHYVRKGMKIIFLQD
jgi:hypothetical protein